MTETEQPVEAKRIPLPKNVTDREFWLDCFQMFAATLLDAQLEKQEGPMLRDFKLATMKESVTVAAQLADAALEEALFRQWVASSQKKRKLPTRTKAVRRKR
jgi:hypothetical protein